MGVSGVHVPLYVNLILSTWLPVALRALDELSIPRFTTYNPHLSLVSNPVSVALVIPLTLVLILISLFVGGVTGFSPVSFTSDEQEVIVIGKIR